MDKTPSLNMPFILPAQAQKHVTHNDALNILDAVVQLTVLSRTIAAPPAAPEPGARYIIAADPTGPWAGNANTLAVFQDGAWVFHMPQTGWRCWVQDEAALLVWDSTIWLTASSNSNDSPANMIPLLGVNATADDVNRLTVGSEASLFNHEGAGHQLKINKNTETDTASLLFQTGFSGRAELATAGNDDISLKVTHTGSNWQEAFRADATSGAVSFPNGTHPNMLVPPISSAGGPDEIYGPPNLQTVSFDDAVLAVNKDRVYFCAFYVDRPTDLQGGMVVQTVASSTEGALIRTGVYHLGEASGNNWAIGSRIADFGTASADTIGTKLFSLSTPTTLQPGWYINAVGTTGEGVSLRFARWMTPGIQHFMPANSGTPQFRVSGPAAFLFSDNQAALIETGLPINWPTNPVSDIVSRQHFIRQLMIPKWRLWT